MPPVKNKTIEELASDLVGDGNSPNWFFVTDEGVVVTVTRSFPIAYSHWQSLKQRVPRKECALEDRKHGCICSVEPIDDGSEILGVIDDAQGFGLWTGEE